MAANEIKIIIGGDPSGFVAATRQVGNSLERIRNATKGPADALPKVETAASKAGDTLKNKVAPGANSAAFALTNVGRVAQDLPFGFVGIQNNLNPLLESFQRLKAETGSGSAAFKALAGSLIGAGGIGLALSVVSSAILIFQNGIGGFGKKAKEAKEAADELAKSIRSISSIQDEAAAGVQGQVAQVNALAAAVSDSNKPYAEHKRALEELKEINKSYFGDLQIEDVATGKLTKTVNEYTQALINNAIQKGFVEEIANVAKEVSKSDEEIRKSRDRLTRAQDALSQKQAEAVKRQLEANKRGAIAQDANVDPEVIRATEELTAAQEELAKSNDKVARLLEQEAVIRNNLNKAVAEGLKFKDLTKGSSKAEVDILKQRIEALKQLESLTGLTEVQTVELAQLEIKLATRDAVKFGFTKDELQQQTEGILEKAFPVNTFEFDIQAKPKIKLAEIKPEIDVAGKTGNNIIEIKTPKFSFSNLKDRTEEARKQLQDSVNSIFSSIQVDVFAGIGESIGNAISGGGDVFKSLFDILATGLQQLGRALIAYGLALKGFKLAIKSLNPGVAIIAGIAAVAAGTAIKASLPKFADGGIATKATVGIFGEAGKEAIIPLDQLPDIVGRLNFNNQAPIILQPSLSFSLTDMQVRLERVTDRRRRLG